MDMIIISRVNIDPKINLYSKVDKVALVNELEQNIREHFQT